ncbi:hypothetical protein KDA_77030 [Dictyobacter alpinus]|uniref:Uncharacterized protein n=1 Tax=Dictyobacter alpinus TaxID=2014873 RepID=A0A402BLL0_9CHLR|nr:hypothetical protein [Dictyobacter alpinus]GCE32219.1 hypothetical protein KDA_77030 [Dictyobacter alpinus]
MIVYRISDSSQGQQTPQQPGQHCTVKLIKRMSGQYWRMARRERSLLNIGAVIRHDLRLTSDQCGEAVNHLLSLRRAAQAIHEFYSSLDPEAMRELAPWGVLTKLGYLDDQTTELLLMLDALAPISMEPSYARVQLQLAVRHLYPHMLISFDEVCSQLKALVEKAQEVRG